MQLIEPRIARGAISQKESDLPIARELTLFVTELQDRRVPHDQLHDVEPTIAFARHEVEMANIAHIRPIPAPDSTGHPSHVAAKAHYDSMTSDFQAAVEAAALAAAGAGDE
jgi:hypothetical protein